ncbi:hypothetical protein, variant [Phialophora macrospora]|uniref:Uncharacterized protein n=1 Tax=Phialophora macrospora TaxID=1851006 RepID=A0A0D2DZF8_9EURO|nr:hypothetical protein, variant [Phialophora macrospora]
MRTAKLPSKRSRRSGSSVWRPDLRARWRAGAFRGRTARPDRGSHVWREHGYGRERICKSDYRGSRIVGLPLRSRRQIHRREDWRRVRVPRHQRKYVLRRLNPATRRLGSQADRGRNWKCSGMLCRFLPALWSR